MYYLLETASIAVIAVIGIIMAVAPKAVARKSLRESRSGLIVVRILGIFIALGAAAVLFLSFSTL